MTKSRKPSSSAAAPVSVAGERASTTQTHMPKKSGAQSGTVKPDCVPPPTPIAPMTMASVAMSVRWGDLDAFNHVNNATFLIYAQEARLAWLAKIDGVWFDETMMPVVAAAQINFRRQLAWPAQIIVELAAKRIGTSSVTITHRIFAADDVECLYADGEVVIVWVEPTSGRSVPLPTAIRHACGSSP